MTKREAGDLTFPFIPSRRRLPLRGGLSSAFGAPLLQGATPLACKSATPKRHSLPDGKVNEMRIPLSSYRHFERSEKSSLQRSNGERQMRSSRSTHAILSLPHKYRVPLRRERSLGYARDDDTRERAISHGFSSDHVEGCPCGAVYPPPSARPFFKGLHKNHVKKRNAQALLTSRWESQRIENTASPHQSLPPRGEGTPKWRIGHSRYESEREKCVSNRRKMTIPLSPISSFRAKREIFLAQRSNGKCEMRSST